MPLNHEIEARIEAALYVAGRPLMPEDLKRAAGISSKRKAVEAARRVARAVNRTLKSIELAELPGQRFVMQLKTEYNPVAKKFSIKPLVPLSALKTLSYIVYFQPISALELVRRRGGQAYKHLKFLEELRFIKGERMGRTKVYTTTENFSEYFGLSEDATVMKQQLMKLGIKRPRSSQMKR